MSHTIAAVSTGHQVSAIGILRLSGDGCIEIAQKVFSGRVPLTRAENRKLELGELHDTQGRVIDQCMAVVSRAPHSYTGEDTVEFHCHGSPALLAAALDTGEKQPAPPMVKMKRPPAPKPEPIGKRYVCGGCGYEYIPELGDPDGDIAPGTLFEKLPEDWVCPECAEPKDQFIEA